MFLFRFYYHRALMAQIKIIASLCMCFCRLLRDFQIVVSAVV